ncbi:MAG: hypothetical protein HWQ41_19340 [Nostoc sp. NOS(2021)]|uniref:hypothetical protein n=1 Tax=Nostoc sp. NOS(2021) TaxID=2815407 RepID=UPI0025E37E02|nr:hypothetical protein [Nostoc sp. NOS(2021)]MBN3897350.1 hypothetical protein [Nostoc sp. NOS(2021)]
MTVTVNELIKKLQSFPPNTVIGAKEDQMIGVVIGDSLLKFVFLSQTDEEEHLPTFETT